MADNVIRPDFGSRNPIFRAIDDLSRDTENMAWLRRAGERARRLNEESRFDGGDDEAA